MQLKIQPITPGDIPLVEQLAYDYNYQLDPQETKKEAVHRWIASVSDEALAGRHYFWLAFAEERIAGFISFQIRTNPFMQETYGFIEDMYIVPSLRRHGYAKDLVSAAITELARHGATKIQLDVLVNNKQALAFWQKLGLALHHYVLSMPLQTSDDRETDQHPQSNTLESS
jgi:ribosomal protein S18 acetylase RimI-like enzyme